MDAKEKILGQLFHERLQVEPEWSIDTHNGFRWWPDKHAQTVEVTTAESALSGETVARIAIRTDLVRLHDIGERQLTAVNLLMQLASLCGIVYDPATRTLSLASAIETSEEETSWTVPLIGLAALIQTGEARVLGPALARTLGEREAISGPPDRGIREEPSEITKLMEIEIAATGHEPSRWSPAEFLEVGSQYLDKPPALLANYDRSGFTVEFPYGDESSLCEVRSDTSHPRYGNGLFVLQTFPVGGSIHPQGEKLALAMNETELARSPFGLGGYTWRDGLLHFTAFFPNVAFMPGLLSTVYFACAFRARAIAQRILGQDWGPDSFSVDHTALWRLLSEAGDD
ncbi:MAG TPA: hypothetical protein VNM43_02905 [Dehalococcoidia bacterium]|nr:hypothetical protein [Dehalococcoidia bacterium]